MSRLPSLLSRRSPEGQVPTLRCLLRVRAEFRSRSERGCRPSQWSAVARLLWREGPGTFSGIRERKNTRRRLKKERGCSRLLFSVFFFLAGKEKGVDLGGRRII